MLTLLLPRSAAVFRTCLPAHAGRRWLLALWLVSTLVACGQGSGEILPPGPDDGRPGGEGGAGGESGSAEPFEVRLAANAQGEHGPDEVGLQGAWTAEAGPDSQIELSFEGGDVCLSGETGAVVDGEYRTYWGAQATSSLCEAEDGSLQAVAECLSPEVLSEFVGIAFTLEGTAVPWLVTVQFGETGRETPASVWLQLEGEAMLLFERASNPFDSSAPAVAPSQLESVTVRAVGTTEGVQSFDFCLKDFRALFGAGWKDTMIPDWLKESGPGKQVDYVGVNLASAEFGEQNLPGVYGSDYIYPSAADVDTYASKGMNIFRVPFRWERMQRELYAELDETELAYLKHTIDAAQDHDATVIIDPHNMARYDDPSLSHRGGDLPTIGVDFEIAAFADFWAKLAGEFANDDLVWFGLMNEPHDMPTETWLEAANAAIAAIRDQGANNLVLVPGNQWTGAHAWFDDYYGTPSSEAMRNVEDPADNFAFELHQYFDAGYSGRGNTCVNETIGVETVEPVTEWLQSEGFRGFLGEFGGSDDPVCLEAIDRLLSHLGENPDEWLGWTAWAASAWGIQHNLRPLSNGEDVLQMQVLMLHMDPP